MNNKVANKEPASQRDSYGDLLGQLVNSSATVVHDEIELVIQRIREKARVSGGGIITVVAGALICFSAFLSLCAALIIGLTAFLPPVMAAFVTGAALALIGGALVFIGYKQLRKTVPKT